MVGLNLLELFTNVRWLFFDVGYTLFDETPAWQVQFEAIAAQLKSWGRDVSVKQVWQTYNEACATFAPRQWLAVVEAFSTSPAEFETLDAISNGWRQELQTVYPGVPDLLRTLRSQYKLGIIANQSSGTADRLRERDLLQYIDHVIGSAEAGVQKPDPKIFQMALQEAGCDATSAVMIGDRIDNDIDPAKALGMKTIHVRQGGGALQIPRSPAETADATVDRIAQIASILLQ